MSTEQTPNNKISRLQLLKQKALQNNNNFKVSRPEVLRQQFIDWNTIRVKPWHEKRSDLTDYFNYGFNEHTFQQYSNKISQKLEQNSSQIQNQYRERLAQKQLPYEQAKYLKDSTPIDYGGLCVPFDQNLTNFAEESNNLHFLDSIFFLNNLNYDTSMLTEFDCYCTSEDLLYGNKHLVTLSEEINLKLQFEIQNSNDQPNLYQFDESVKKLTNSSQRAKQNMQNSVQNNISINPHLLVMPGQVKFTSKNNVELNQNYGNHVQDSSFDQMASQGKYDGDRGQTLKENILPIQNLSQKDEEFEKRKSKKREKKIKKDKKEKKDKKRKKHKKHKRHVTESLDIEFEHMESDRNLSPKQVIFEESESSYLQSSQKSSFKPTVPMSKEQSGEDGLSLEQGKIFNYHTCEGLHHYQNQGNKRAKSQTLQGKIKLISDIGIIQINESYDGQSKKTCNCLKIPDNQAMSTNNNSFTNNNSKESDKKNIVEQILHQQPKPVWLNDQKSNDDQEQLADSQINKKPRQGISWMMRNIHGIINSNLPPRPLQLKAINKQN